MPFILTADVMPSEIPRARPIKTRLRDWLALMKETETD